MSTVIDAIELNTKYWFAHGANCRGIMGAGIAKEIAERLPEVCEVDRKCYVNGWAEPGLFSVHVYHNESNYISATVFNLYTQQSTGADAKYEHVIDCFKRLERGYIQAKHKEYEAPDMLFIPAIGCGIGGLKWEAVEAIINEAAPTLPITLVEYDGS